MNVIPDLAARMTALTAVDRTLLVEAGAGSGKTSVMAGRVAVLFAASVEPKHIAAVTFTEFAASELRLRIERFTTALSRGEVPRDLRQAFPDGVTEAQKAHVHRACENFDQLTCSTIHGFAQALIKPYPAEAGIDPGANIVDPAEADLAFKERYDAWLKERLSGEGGDGLIAELILASESSGLKLIGEVAQFLRKNRDADCAQAAWSPKAMTDLIAAAKQFETEIGGYGYQEEKTSAACRVLRDLADLLDGHKLADATPSNAALIAALNFERDETCFTQTGSARALQASGKWQDAAAKAGHSKTHGKAAFDAVVPRYKACHEALEGLLGAIAGELLSRLRNELRSLRDDWRDYKRDAALLDFDDLLYTARNLLRDHEEVRRALSQRFRHVMVDEFQDTDPLQIEILWLICGEECEGSDALARPLRPGGLFMVGDPKQAIYRFRGADVNAYIAARSAIDAGSRIKITANFRSVEPILAFVNKWFEPVLSAAGQPGFSELSSIHPAIGTKPCVCALDVVVEGEKPKAGTMRDGEALAVADLCNRLVGNLQVRDHHTGEMRTCRFGDIALLAPVGTELWRFEEALEELAIPVSTQAGKGFFRRQEIQDLIALTRSLADPRDTLAFGALLRGPLVGLTETDLLDISEALPVDPERQGLPMLTLRTDPASVNHALAKDVLMKLSSLRRRVRTTTPNALLADAIAALHVRPQIRQRFKAGAERAVANADLFLEMARAYDVRGLRAFASDMRANWEEAVRQVEGRPDAEQEAVSLITVHAAKGLEWPVVIPINMTGTPKSESGLVQDRSKNLFSIPILGKCSADYAGIEARAEEEQRRERVRLWYVAATRARDLLILPRHSAALSDKCWAKLVELGVTGLPPIKPEEIGAAKERTVSPQENGQTREIFAAESAAIFAGRKTVIWRRPSRSELDQASQGEAQIESAEIPEAIEIAPAAVLGCSTRGTILHKLIEEVLTGEGGDEKADLEARAADLIRQTGQEPAADPKTGICAAELAGTVLRTLALPDVAALRQRLVPELPLFGSEVRDGQDILLSGQADAVAFDETGAIDVVVDWKSDVSPEPSSIGHYRQQIGDYRRLTKAKRALLVFMTTGQVVDHIDEITHEPRLLFTEPWHEPDLSLEEMFVRDVERLELTPESVRSAMDARHSLVRKKLLADYGLTEETLDSASEETKSELASNLMYEIAHSPDAKFEHGFYEAAVAREKRSLVKTKSEEISGAQRKRAMNCSIPQNLVPAVQQRSTYLFYSELRDRFKSKYIEEIEKSDFLIPEFKAVALKAEEPHMPSMYEVAAEMSTKLLHPDALGQILSERHAAKQARGKHRREKRREFFSFHSWLGALPLFVRKLIAPVELKSVLSAFGEEARFLKNGPALGPALGIEIITPRVVEDVLSWCNEIRRDVRSGKTPRATTLWLMVNVARDYLASGMFHIYRGHLSMQGTALKSINTYCLDELTKLGLMTAEEKNAALKATNEDIRAVG